MAGSTPASLTADPLAGGAPPRPQAGLGREAWRRFRRHKLAFSGALILTVIVLAVLVAPWLWPVPTNEIDFSARLQGPSLKHPFGTDDLGQDVLARMLYGGRLS